MKREGRYGPGLLVTAAFIGPGTVTTASVAGAQFGYALLWAILFSVLATMVLQEMSSRLGLVTRAGLGEALRTTTRNPLLRQIIVILVVAAIAFGNTAFETGNITGAAIGLQIVTPVPKTIWVLLIGATALLLLCFGAYRHVEKFLIGLVVVMSIAFVGTALIVRPSMSDLVQGLCLPRVPHGSLLTVVALIGTTVVPYNLFLHASTVVKKWSADVPVPKALSQSRRDTVVSIALGGAITLAIAVSAAGCFQLGTRISSAADMAQQLQPLLGAAAKWFFAIGLFAAGLTSTITAPLAAAFATAGALGWPADTRSGKFRAVWALVLVAGTIGALVGKSPIAAIIFAQAANGILLPIIAMFLLIVMNRHELLGEHANRTLANVLGSAVVLVAGLLGAFQLWKVLTKILNAL